MAVLKYKNPNYVEGGTEPLYKALDYLYAGVEEAPIDGKYYARKDGKWVSGTSTITLIAETNTGDNTDVADVVFTVTIDGVSLLVNNGDSISVEGGKTIKVECPVVEHYSTTASVEFTAVSFSSYIKTFTYTYVIPGIYILDRNGKLWTSNQWNTSNNANANAIAILTNNVKVLLALTLISNNMQISYSNNDPLEKYTTCITDSSVALVDYNGRINTNNIMVMNSSTSYAAGACNAFTFPDGKTKGYLPSLGEWWEIYQNKSAVNAALSACGGTAIADDGHWSSTFYNVDTNIDVRDCWVFYWYGTLGNSSLSSSKCVRAVAAYPN